MRSSWGRGAGRRRAAASVAVAAGLAAGAVVLAPAGAVGRPAAGGALAASATSGSWSMAGHDPTDDRDNPDESTVTTANVSGLQETWSRTFNGTVAATPAVVDGRIYVPDEQSDLLWVLDASTGAVIWSRTIGSWTGETADATRATPAVVDGKIILGDHHGPNAGGAHVVAASAADGSLLWNTVVDPDPDAAITGAPTVVGGVVYIGISSSQELASDCCTWRGSVVALDENTGAIKWRTMTAPAGYTGAAVWGSAPAVDSQRGLVYIGTGNNYSVPAGVCSVPGQTGCTTPVANDYVDSLLALRTSDGSVAWSLRGIDADVYSSVCKPSGTCGPDSDFASAPSLFTVGTGSSARELVGIGQKSGVYWAADATTGALVWQTRVGPGGSFGGIQWGSATDGTRIYVAESNAEHVSTTLKGGAVTTGGSFTALDPATGAVLWQTPDPQGAHDLGYVTTANGVVYAGSDAVSGSDMYALDAATGRILWSHAAGGAVMGGAAIVNGTVYWSSGYYQQTCPNGAATCTAPNVLHAFALPTGVLQVSANSDRSSPTGLDGATLTGNQYIFAAVPASDRSVTFSLDGKVFHAEGSAPFDFNGTAAVGATAFPTTTLTNGTHTISAAIVNANNVSTSATATFTVANTSAATALAPLRVSTSADRSNPVTLDGAGLTGTVYIFDVPTSPVVSVQFLLDGSPFHTESTAPYDFNGSGAVDALPYSLTGLTKTTHTVTAVTTLTTGVTTSQSGTFTVN